LKAEKRSRFEVSFEIMVYCKQPIFKTSLMYRTNICWKKLNEVLLPLIDSGLIEKVEIPERRHHHKDKRMDYYVLTDVGRETLGNLEKGLNHFPKGLNIVTRHRQLPLYSSPIPI